MAKSKGKGGRGDQQQQAHTPRGQVMTASERQALARLAKEEERRQKKKETKRIVAKVKKGLAKPAVTKKGRGGKDEE